MIRLLLQTRWPATLVYLVACAVGTLSYLLATRLIP